MTRRTLTAGLIAAGATVGAVVRGFLPPFVLDVPFWRDFWSGPPAAGVFALLGAGLAVLAARVTARTARRGAERQEWWDRASWALDLARADDHVDRLIGLTALEALRHDATATESALVAAVTDAVSRGCPLDTVPGSADDGSTSGRTTGSRGRWSRWPRRR